MKFSNTKFHNTRCILILFFSVSILLSINLSIVEGELTGTEVLKVSEHRVSIVQHEEDPHSITVFDEFWIENRGDGPYRNVVFNSLPDDITIEEGMFCYISENGDHTCYPWKHEDYNYYWEGNYTVLPTNYARSFDFEIKIYPISNNSDILSISKVVDSTSAQVTNLIELDTWAWVRDGFYRGWTTFINFTINNPFNRTEIYELENLRVPPGVRFEIYIDNNSNYKYETTDILMGFDGDYNGVLEPLSIYDSNENSIPDLEIPAYENRSFLIYLRADYSLHFLTKYQKSINPSNDGIIEINKKTIYDTSLMRVFIIPHEGFSIETGDVEIEKRESEGSLFFYGEWSGVKNDEVTFKLKERTVKNNNSNNEIFIILIFFLLAALLITIIIFRSQKNKAAQKKKIMDSNKRQGSEFEKSRSKKNGKRSKNIDDSMVKSQSKALKRLEEDYKSGRLGKEIYEELKKRYMEFK